MAENGVIGRDGGLPWRLSSDLKRFKATTMGKPIIMGRKTWESIGRAAAGPAEHRGDARHAPTVRKAARSRGSLRRGDRAGHGARPLHGRRRRNLRRSAAARSTPQALPLADRLTSPMCWPRSTATRVFRRSTRRSGALVRPRRFRPARRTAMRRAMPFTNGVAEKVALQTRLATA